MEHEVQQSLSELQKNIVLSYLPLNPGILKDSKVSENMIEELNRSSQQVLDHSIWSTCIIKWKETVRKDFFYTKKMQYNVFSIEDLQLLLHMKDSLDDAAEELIKHENEVTCSTCLAKIDAQETCNLFTNSMDDNHTLGTLLNSSAKVFEDKQDDPFLFICFQCFKALKMMHNFRQMCEKNAKHFLQEVSVMEKSYDPLEDPLDVTNLQDIFNDFVPKNEFANEENDEVQDSYENLHQSDTSDYEAEPSHPKAAEMPLNLKRIRAKVPENHNDHTYIQKSEWHCEKCGKKFQSAKLLTEHKKDLHAWHEKIWTCWKCKKTLTKFIYFRMHMEKMHNVVHPELPPKTLIPNICDQCGVSYSTVKALKLHKNNSQCKAVSVTPIKPKDTYTCSHCNKSFQKKHNLMAHMTVHKPERPFVCEICGKCFKQPGALKAHMETHNTERNFHCTQCSYSTTTNGNLLVHKRTHLDKKLYSCDMCDRGFMTASNRLKHIRVVHNKIKAFKCPLALCDKRFSSKFLANKHTVVHTGNKPYHCPVCNSSYGWYHRLQSHMKTLHPGVEIPKQGMYLGKT